jgi:hypothetical protein
VTVLDRIEAHAVEVDNVESPAAGHFTCECSQLTASQPDGRAIGLLHVLRMVAVVGNSAGRRSQPCERVIYSWHPRKMIRLVSIVNRLSASA